nr:MAG TPA: InsA C-terminal domain [Caudoviricetes sp.]
MLTRLQHRINRQYSPEVMEAREALKEKGWSYRSAAPCLGVHYMQVYFVLNGIRKSASLLRRIHALPSRRYTSTNNHSIK